MLVDDVGSAGAHSQHDADGAGAGGGGQHLLLAHRDPHRLGNTLSHAV